MSDSFLLANGKPDVDCLVSTLTLCNPAVAGGVNWLDQVRDCNGPTDSADGRKHADPNDPDNSAMPWEGASNCKPFVADEIINECTARDLAAFWRSMLNQGMGTSEEATYAVALVEHLVFGPMMAQLDKEVELSAQHRHARGWVVLAARWVTKFSKRRNELTLEYIRAQAQQVAAPAMQMQQPGNDPLYAPLLQMLPDPTLDAQTKELLRMWYDLYVAANIPPKFLDRVPKLTDRQLQKVIDGLRGPDGKASVVIPYLCRNEAEIIALEPWTEVVIPNQNTDVQTILYHIEYVSKSELDARVADGYDADWVAEVKKKAGQQQPLQLPVRAKLLGPFGLLAQHGSSPTPTAGSSSAPAGNNAAALVQLVHAVYLTEDEDGVPAAYCTTFHRDYKGGPNAQGKTVPGYAKHELVETVHGNLPYTAVVREWRARSIASSRSVPEMVATQQKLIKDTLDQTLDYNTVLISPPMNVYESPAGVQYDFAPWSQNYVKQGKEPQPGLQLTGQGLMGGEKMVALIEQQVARRFGLVRENIPPTLMQLLQDKDARRFLVGWTSAFQQVLALWQTHGDDAEFARITGAPVGWLEERRKQPGLLTAMFDFDVRELDSEQFIEQVKAMNTVVIPNDVLGVIQRGPYAAWMAQGIVGPRVAKRFLQDVPSASGALRDRARQEVNLMYSGNPPRFIDKDDPTASGLLNYTIETVMQNPQYLMALTDEALVAVAGQQAQQLAQQMPNRQPNPLFSNWLVKWLENLKFIGVTQQRNKQIGRQGVSAEPAEG